MMTGTTALRLHPITVDMRSPVTVGRTSIGTMAATMAVVGNGTETATTGVIAEAGTGAGTKANGEAGALAIEGKAVTGTTATEQRAGAGGEVRSAAKPNGTTTVVTVARIVAGGVAAIEMAVELAQPQFKIRKPLRALTPTIRYRMARAGNSPHSRRVRPGRRYR